MSAFDNVLVGAFLRERDLTSALDVAERSLRLCHLEDYRDKPAGNLTTGLKKRLELARALATQPKLLMLDEVMAGLSGAELKEAMELLKEIKAQGVTLLVVEHVMEALMPIADKVVVLDGGVKIAEGPPREIVESERVIAAYLGEKFSRRLKELKT
jgi:branched-chain amino acid transport system ATP-binding protein